MFFKYQNFFFILLLGVLCIRCNTTKELAKGEVLVHKNIIKIDAPKKIKNLSTLEYELSTTIKQKPNRKWLGVPRQWFYYNHNDPQDTTKWDNWVNRNISESPSLYSTDKAKATALSMQNFLKNKGYFNAEVGFETEIKRQKATTTYFVSPRDQYYYNKITYKANDPKIQKLLNEIYAERLIKSDTPVDEALYNQEAKRIEQYIRNNGYYDFNIKYILPLEADSSDLKVTASLEVASPSDSTFLQVYDIGKVYIYPSYNPLFRERYQVDTIINNVHFMSIGDIGIKERVILRSIYLNEGSMYRQADVDKTRIQLSKLGIYKFVKINSFKNKDKPNTIDFQIFLPAKKKMGLDGDFEFNTATNSTFGNNAIGTAINFNYRNRNLIRGAELLKVSGGIGVEFPLGDSTRSLVNSLNIDGSVDLFVPRFIDMGFLKLMRTFKVVSPKFYEELSENAKSRFSANYSYVNLTDFYRSNSTSLSFGYDVNLSRNRRFVFNPVGINFLNLQPVPNSYFEQIILAENELLRRSFDDQLFTGFLFRDLTYSLATKTNRFGETWFMRATGEISGLELYALNALITPDKNWNVINPLSHYYKLEVEGRYTRQFSTRHAFASRILLGGANSFGKFTEVVPYVKQFFVGGPNSIRAWDVRELGPGSYVDPDAISPFYQAGDLKLEMNAEYKFDIWWVFEGAVFVDAGNIWTLREDSDRLGSKISKDFFKQIAVGAGTGLRMDFSFFVIRLDLGYKIRNPYPDLNNSYWNNPHLWRGINWNLAIGYPFY